MLSVQVVSVFLVSVMYDHNGLFAEITCIIDLLC